MKRISTKSKKRWTTEEIELIKNKKSVPNRSFFAIRNKIAKMGMKKKREPRPRWTKENIDKLQQLAKEGKSAREICALEIFKNISQNAIQKQMCRMGLSKKLKVFKFPIEVKVKFEKFLQDHWEGKTPQDLEILWNKENARYPTNHRKVVAYLTRLNIKIPYYEVQKINNLRKKEQKIIAENKDSVKSLEEKIRLERIRLMRKRISKNKDLWTGIEIKENLEEVFEQVVFEV